MEHNYVLQFSKLTELFQIVGRRIRHLTFVLLFARLEKTYSNYRRVEARVSREISSTKDTQQIFNRNNLLTPRPDEINHEY